MGGATSKFDENDWSLANGELKENTSMMTVDGAPPTRDYQVYNFMKRHLNQREFDLTDQDSNLLYTSRQVPGTIACFDVMGRGIDDYKLRVNADLSRRYWTIYRYDTPTFEGQVPDKEATDKVTIDRLNRAEINPEQDSFRTPKLYKKGCVVVSWSRYMAVATQYGPPREEDIQKYEQELQMQEVEAASSPKSSSNQSPDKTRPVKLQGSDSTSTDEPKVTNLHDQQQQIRLSHSMPEMTTTQPPRDPPEVSTTTTIPKSQSVLETTSISTSSISTTTTESFTKPLRTWFRQQSEQIKEKSKAMMIPKRKKTPRNPREGVLDLDHRPLLLCQEIYTRLIGNHQTSIVSKRTVLDLLRQDEEQHKEDTQTADDDSPEDNVEIILQAQEAMEDLSQEDSSNNSESSATVKIETKSTTSEPGKKQPLVGYMMWEHTLTSVNKMKIHVAKGSDLALHVVLAIIVNQGKLHEVLEML